jgi:predicted AlkP superfamily phosphohydrolase/phosphomutase
MRDGAAQPLIIIGLDAGTPDLIRRWAREGHMPNVAALMGRGCWGETAGAELISEHGVWLSLFSGVSRAHSGYYFFRQLEPGTYDLRPASGFGLDAVPFWAHLAGRRVAVIDAPDCYPVRGLEGIQLSNWAGHVGWRTSDPAHAPHAEPARLLADARRIYGPPAPVYENPDADFRENCRIRQRLLAQIRKKGELCRELLRRGGHGFDLVVVVFSETHAASHQFWQYNREAPDGDGANGVGHEKTNGRRVENVDGRRGRKDDGRRAGASGHELTHALRDIYQAVDREAGLLLAELTPEANVFVLSSVGVRTSYPTTGLAESFCRRLGYQATPRPAPLALGPLALARRTLPESWRVRLSRLLLSRDARERLLAEQFRHSTDWARTTAFALPSFYTSFIRVNLRGREPQGAVRPGAEYEALLARLEADLRQLADAETGEAAVERVHRAAEVFGDGRPPRVLPDLFVEWRHERFMSRVAHPRAELTQPRPEFFRASDHTQRGFVAAAGPSVRARGPVGDINLLDLAPTFLQLLGAHAPTEMTGAPIREVGIREVISSR